MALSVDRDRIRAFGHFLWRRFVDDRCFETAGALSYTTLFALVPLLAAVFGILTILPSFQGMSEHLQHFIFRNFVPAAGRSVQHYLIQFAGNASKLTTIGIVVFLVTSLAMLANIEERFNRIWRVSVRRSPVSRVLMYWAALTLGPLLVVAGLALTSYITALPLLGHSGDHVAWRRHLWGVLPFLVTLAGLFIMYELVPHRRVPWRHGAFGALLAALLFTFAKWAFSLYVSNVPSYQQIYGQLAVIPIFLVWVFLSWVIVLLGASITASISAFDYRPKEKELPMGWEFFGLLHVLKHFVHLQREGHGISEEALLHCEPFMTDDLLQRYLVDLQRHDLVRCMEDDNWVMVRNLDEVPLAELYRAGRYHLPLDVGVLQTVADGLPSALSDVLDDVIDRLRDQMHRPLGEFFHQNRAEAPTIDSAEDTS